MNYIINGDEKKTVVLYFIKYNKIHLINVDAELTVETSPRTYKTTSGIKLKNSVLFEHLVLKTSGKKSLNNFKLAINGTEHEVKRVNEMLYIKKKNFKKLKRVIGHIYIYLNIYKVKKRILH